LARPESVAVAGYFPTPQHLIPLIGSHLAVGTGGRPKYADPCAGDGAALVGLSEQFGSYADLYTCEMEATRHAGLLRRFKDDYADRSNAVHGDAFRIEFARAMSLLLLNPPYDIDPVHGRLEQRFLDRFTGALLNGGVLVFIVPNYALEASATTLALHYENVQCFRFPKEDFAAFKQVVVFANRTDTRLSPDAEILSNVRAWAKSLKGVAVLGSKSETHTIGGSWHSTATWQLRDFDFRGLVSKHRPWRETTRGKSIGTLSYVPHVLPELPVQDLLFRIYPVATAPRPAHIAAGIASGLFNGRQVESDTPGMDPLLVKGVFTRDYTTISESVNSKGDVSFTQVQRPKLETTILNLKTKRYTRLAAAGEGQVDRMDGLGIDGLLKHYGPSLMDVMLRQCPVQYNPKRDGKRLPLVKVERPLYRAQENAAKAIYQLLGGPGLTRAQRRFKAAILLGEVGTGKTVTALNVGATMAKRVLTFCPPHLLADWKDEVGKVLPHAAFRVLSNPTDMDALVDVPSDQLLIAVVSRETAKLGHGWEGVASLGCPKCGAPLPTDIDLAKKRACCQATPILLKDDLARAAAALALHIAPHSPNNGNVAALMGGRHLQRYRATLAKRQNDGEGPEWLGFNREWVRTTLAIVVERLRRRYDDALGILCCALLLADYEPQRIADLAVEVHGQKPEWEIKGFAQRLTCLLPFRSELQSKIGETTYAGGTFTYGSSLEGDLKSIDGHGLRTYNSELTIRRVNGQLTINENESGSEGLARLILSKLCAAGKIVRAKNECGEQLYQAVPEPRRFPLSDYIAKYHPNFFELLILDEGQDYKNGDSAQSIAAHRLTSLGIPTILMTGSLMNGYAASLFTNLWYLSRTFREEFGREELQKYLDRYGYRKRIVSEEDLDREALTYGSHSDRVERTGRLTGYAPGVLPLFLFRHLLAISVTLQKADLDIELPACRHITAQIEPSKELLERYNKLEKALTAQIRKDRFDKELAGKLFGALSELPSYLDRATVDSGNQDDGSYAIHYPESVGQKLVEKVAPFPAKKILPKEQWIIDTVKAELAEGRNCMVFSWHVSLLPRLARLLEKATGEKVVVFYSDKVPTSKRKEWINANIVAKGVRIMVANPVGIQTGLNNLVHFSTQVWAENPACNPETFRQVTGRIHRIGQTKECRVYFPTYEGTLQVLMHQLLMTKVAVSTATDGLDSESVLLAAGAGDDALFMGLSIGRQMWEMISREAA
jgi:Uncharacterised methyltransferase family (DUF6094)